MADSSTTGPLVSVRGTAERSVDPDYGVVRASIEAVAGSKGRALSALDGAVRQVTDGLARLGGTPRTAATDRAPLTWTTQQQRSWQERQGRSWTGKVHATLSLEIRVRDLSLIDDVAKVVNGVDDASLGYQSWHVDEDNPAWAELRAEAIHVAAVRARDYARAMGTTVRAVEHIADGGLLAGDGGGMRAMAAGAPMGASRGRGAEPEGPAILPVPQSLVAQIEARFVLDPVDPAQL